MAEAALVAGHAGQPDHVGCGSAPRDLDSLRIGACTVRPRGTDLDADVDRSRRTGVAERALHRLDRRDRVGPADEAELRVGELCGEVPQGSLVDRLIGEHDRVDTEGARGAHLAHGRQRDAEAPRIQLLLPQGGSHRGLAVRHQPETAGGAPPRQQRQVALHRLIIERDDRGPELREPWLACEKRGDLMPTARSGSPLSRADNRSFPSSSSNSARAIVCPPISRSRRHLARRRPPTVRQSIVELAAADVHMLQRRLQISHGHLIVGAMTTEAAPRLIAIGETMMMLVPAGAESLSTAEELHMHAGGAESNVAYHVAQAGLSSAWVSVVGDDVLGHRIHRSIESHGVDTRWVTFDATAPTGVYFKDPGQGVLYYRAGSAASRMSRRTCCRHPTGRGRHRAPVWDHACAVGELRRARGHRVRTGRSKWRVAELRRELSASLWPAGARLALRTLADRADIVFVGLDEAQALWGCGTADDVRALIPDPARLVVKDGDVGATEFTPGAGVRAARPSRGPRGGRGRRRVRRRVPRSPLRGRTATSGSGRPPRARLVLLSTSDFAAESAAMDEMKGTA